MKYVVPTVRQGGVSVALVMVQPLHPELIEAQLNSSCNDNGYGAGI
jgi:hypothetical protein